MSKNINIDTVRNERISQIDEIWNSDNKGSNARISFTTNIINDVIQKRVILKYVKGQGKKAQSIEFHKLNKIDNSNIEILAVGIGHDVTRYYNKAVKITDVQDLGDVMINQLTELFTKKTKNNKTIH